MIDVIINQHVQHYFSSSELSSHPSPNANDKRSKPARGALPPGCRVSDGMLINHQRARGALCPGCRVSAGMLMNLPWARGALPPGCMVSDRMTMNPQHALAASVLTRSSFPAFHCLFQGGIAPKFHLRAVLAIWAKLQDVIPQTRMAPGPDSKMLRVTREQPHRVVPDVAGWSSLRWNPSSSCCLSGSLRRLSRRSRGASRSARQTRELRSPAVWLCLGLVLLSLLRLLLLGLRAIRSVLRATRSVRALAVVV
jgi:hypothetical protein